MPVLKRWTHDGEEPWEVEIEHDRMKVDEPMVVTIWTNHHDGMQEQETLVCTTPAVAREMAAALIHYADEAERANAR